MGKQERIESLISKSIDMIQTYKNIITDMENHIKRLEDELLELDDPHVLIPRSYGDIEEWLLKVAFPDLMRKTHTFKNKALARRAQYVCNTFQIDYYIKRISNEEKKPT